MVKINIGAKNLTSGVKYIQPVTNIQGNLTKQEEQVLFMAATLKEEVLQGTVEQQAKQAKKLKKIVKGFLVAGGVAIQTAPRALATGLQATATNPITPATILDYGMTLAFILVASGVAFAMIALTAAGVARMFKRRDIADAWSTDIVKGLVQVLISIPTVLLLFYIAQMVFKNLPKFGSLF